MDGFDAIIIVVPWPGFQVSVDPILYDPWLYNRLHTVMAVARKLGIYVVARIGAWVGAGDWWRACQQACSARF